MIIGHYLTQGDGSQKKERQRMGIPERQKRFRLWFWFVLVVAVTLCIVDEVNARDYQVRRKTPHFVVDAEINRNPPVRGINTIRIQIRDAMGRYLTGGRVFVNYYMPPMPGMVPMNYTVPAVPSGRGYAAQMNFIMTGPWNIVIRVQSGTTFWKVIFPIDVR